MAKLELPNGHALHLVTPAEAERAAAAEANKAWGRNFLIARDAKSDLCLLDIDHGGYCSEHRHWHKFNLFQVQAGRLLLTLWSDDDGQMSPRAGGGWTMHEDGDRMCRIVEPGDPPVYLPPRYFHCFEALAPTLAYEFCACEAPNEIIDPNDIERRTESGNRFDQTDA